MTEPRYKTLFEYQVIHKKLGDLYRRSDGRTAEGKRVKQRIIQETMKLVGEWKQLLYGDK